MAIEIMLSEYSAPNHKAKRCIQANFLKASSKAGNIRDFK